MKTNKVINVLYDGKIVGTLALMKNRNIAFEYSDEWIESGFSISPFSLPLKKNVFIAQKDYFRGLFGVFSDSLPDAWGQLLLDRMLKKNGYRMDELNALDRLAIVGDAGMGALTYEPQHHIAQGELVEDLDELADSCWKILNTEYTEQLDELYQLGGTSGGARPKVMVEIEGESWIIKFPAHVDGKNSGKMEYDYSLCAKRCGIDMPETRLFPSKKCKGYFGIKRFDRENVNGNIKRKHMLTAAALLELDFEQPSLDYHSLMKLTRILTRDNEHDVKNMYKRMCFNVYAHNRDDHSKNFSFIYEEEEKGWRLSPAYDLTYSNTYYGEHTTTVDGNGKNPEEKELVEVGIQAALDGEWCVSEAKKIKEVVQEMLAEYCGIEN